MNKNISCWECAFYDGYDVNDYKIEYYCEHDIPTKMDNETGDIHPKTNCVMFEPKHQITTTNK
jgi:hypothetical protein